MENNRINKRINMPTLKVIHIAKSLKKANRTNQNLSISMSLPTPCRRRENNESPTMAKKHRGFGGKLEVQSFD